MKFEKMKITDLISEISMGPFGSNIKVECFVNKGIPVLNGSNLDGFVLKEDSFRYVTSDKADSLGKANAHRGDVVITHRGTLGQIVFIPQNSLYDRYVISQSQFRVRCNDKILPEYLVYYFHTRIGQHKLLSNASQVGVPALARASTTFQKIEIEVPELKNQRKIVNLLETIRQKIEINNSINENLQAQAQAMFKNLIANIQKQVPFTSVIQVLGGGTPKTSKQEYWNGEIPFFTPKDVGTPYALTTEKNITPLGLDNCNSRLYPIDTVFLTARGTVGKVSLAGIPMAMNQSCYALLGKNELHPIVVYHYVLETVNALKHKASGAVFDAIITRDFDAEYVPELSSEQINNFVSLAEPMYADILNRTTENQRLAALRDTLLPKLMNGEIDLSNLDL